MFLENIKGLGKKEQCLLEAIQRFEKSKKFIISYTPESATFIQTDSLLEEFQRIKNFETFIEEAGNDKGFVCKNENFYNFLSIHITTHKTYIEIGSSKYLEFNDKKEVQIDYSSFYKKGSYEFESEYSIKVRTKKGYYYPLTLKGIGQSHFLFYEFFRTYLLVLKKENLLIKDLLKEYTKKHFLLSVPIDFSFLRDAKNKKHLLELKTNRNIPKSLNKYPLSLSYTFLKSIKYLEEKEDIPKLMEFMKKIDICGHDLSTRAEKEVDKVKSFFTLYFCFYFATQTTTNNTDIRWLIKDYIHLCFLNKKKINLKIKSLKRIEREHDEMSMKQTLSTEEIVIKKSNPFNLLKLPEQFERIEDAKRLYQEGVINRNCVFSYLDAINSENCIIYSTMYEGERHTIEIGIRDNRFVLEQIKNYNNRNSNVSLVKELSEILEKAEVRC